MYISALNVLVKSTLSCETVSDGGLAYNSANQGGPYIIQNGKPVPLSSFNTGQEDFQGGFVLNTTLFLSDQQLNGYLKNNKDQMDAISDYAAKGGIVGGALLKANPWVGGTVGTYLGLEGLNSSNINGLFNQVTLDYLSLPKVQQTGLYLIIQEVDVSAMGLSNTSYTEPMII